MDAIDSGLWPQKDMMYLTYNLERKELGNARDFKLKQCHFDCPWLITGTQGHELVLCTNRNNLPRPGQHVKSNVMKKGAVPTAAFRQMFKESCAIDEETRCLVWHLRPLSHSEGAVALPPGQAARESACGRRLPARRGSSALGWPVQVKTTCRKHACAAVG